MEPRWVEWKIFTRLQPKVHEPMEEELLKEFFLVLTIYSFVLLVSDSDWSFLDEINYVNHTRLMTCSRTNILPKNAGSTVYVSSYPLPVSVACALSDSFFFRGLHLWSRLSTSSGTREEKGIIYEENWAKLSMAECLSIVNPLYKAIGKFFWNIGILPSTIS